MLYLFMHYVNVLGSSESKNLFSHVFLCSAKMGILDDYYDGYYSEKKNVKISGNCYTLFFS